MQSSLAPEYESTALQGRRSNEVCQSPSLPIFVSFSWRAEMHHRRFLFSPKSVQEETDKAEHIFDISHLHMFYTFIPLLET